MSAWRFNPLLGLIFTILILWEFSESKADEIFIKEVGRKLFKGKIVYDVTEVIRNDKNLNGTEILPKDLYSQENGTLKNYYFVANDAAGFDNCWWEENNSGKCRAKGIKGISITFGDKAVKPDVLALRDRPITNNTILNLLKLGNSTIDSITILLQDALTSQTINKIHDYLVHQLKINSMQQSIKIGLEYDDDFLERCGEERLSSFQTFNHTILKISVSPLTTLLSYKQFYDKVNRLLQKNRQLVRRLNPDCAMYIRLQNVDWRTTISWEHYDKYNGLMTTFLHTFSEQNNGTEIFIFSPISKRVHMMTNNEFLRQSASIRSFEDWNKVVNFTSQKLLPLACEYQQLANLTLSNVQSILFRDPGLKMLSLILANGQNQINLQFNSTVSLILGGINTTIEKQVEEILEMLRENPARINISRVCIDSNHLNKTENVTELVKLLQSHNVDVCCWTGHSNSKEFKSANISIWVGENVKSCGALVNSSEEIVEHFDVAVTKTEDLFAFLTHFQKMKLYFERLCPGKMLTPEIHIFYHGKNSEEQDSSYCDSDKKKINEYYQTIYSFANIHGWSNVVNYATEFGFWSLVKTDEQINQRKLTFFVPFRSNVPRTEGEELPMTYPCIQITQDASHSRINFSKNLFSGATFRTGLRETPPLSATELQTLVKLALERFPSVELIAASRGDFELIQNVIVDKPPSSPLNVSVPLVYVEVPLAVASNLQNEILTVLSKKHAAIHVSNWESMPSEQRNLLKSFHYSSPSNFGVTVQNCSHELNSSVATLKSLPFMPQVKYVVCNVPPVTPTNLNMDWIEKYLGTLFYTKSYMEHFLSIGKETGNSVEVMFRLNYVCSQADEMEYYLRFLNDVNQHSATYKIKYFLVRAFETESSSTNCSNSWWRLDSYADLSNISTYVNREDEYAGREARVPFQPPPAPAPVQEQNSNHIYFIITIPIFALLVLALLALLIHERKVKTRILTEREVRQFYNGSGESTVVASNNCIDFENMKFPKHYEIPIKDIKTEEKIGSGQFGVVNRGILSKHIEVAIKIPRSDCGKEQFKSTLSELKILCHIGEHVNIVSFLGACTKDIANGSLYIVIEYCKNGCLLKYLRENRETGDEDAFISLYEMNGFALQIAAGMEYIAEKRVIHGDLAARNVLLTSEMTCKIADFGLSRRLYEMNEYVKTSQEPLPWRWMAPESLRDMEFTTKSDVWSYGVTLWEIFSSGMVPYPGLSWTVNYVTELVDGMRMGKAPHAPDNIHAKTLDCWDINPESRPTFTELKEFFIGLRNDQYLKLNQA